jgi:predicted Rossmann fold flavoprotein
VDATKLDIAIVGAGAAGLMAAIFAGRASRQSGAPVPPLRIVALDGAAKIGAKILVAGGGRCNVTHEAVRPEDFAGAKRNQVAKVLRTFDVAATVQFFADLGVKLKTETTGKLFPITDDAHTVLEALLGAVREAGGEIWPACRVHEIRRVDDGFVLRAIGGELKARRIILATGGKSLPKTGSDGGGYALAQAMGHSVRPTTPALVPLVLPKNHWLMGLSGISVETELSLASGTGRVLHRQGGAMLFTHFGLSGPAIMDISRHWIAAHAADASVRLTANLLPGQTPAQIDGAFIQHATNHPRTTIASLVGVWLPQRLAAALCQQVGVAPDLALAHLSKDQRRALVQGLTALPLPVERDRGYNFAEATAGGIPLDEVDLATMASRVCPGLFLCGEVLDVDGRIGGYNFQWAWTTGRLAGLSAAASLKAAGSATD